MNTIRHEAYVHKLNAQSNVFLKFVLFTLVGSFKQSFHNKLKKTQNALIKANRHKFLRRMQKFKPAIIRENSFPFVKLVLFSFIYQVC